MNERLCRSPATSMRRQARSCPPLRALLWMAVEILTLRMGVNQRVRKVTPAGAIPTVARNETYGYNGDGIPATNAELDQPSGIAVDSAGNLYIVDSFNERVRVVCEASTLACVGKTDGDIYTLAGNGTPGYQEDEQQVTGAELFEPFGVAVDVAGHLYIADTENLRIRLVTASIGTITTMAGYFGDGGPAAGANLLFPFGVAVDNSGNLYIADSNSSRIRIVAH
jgi:DNA-binding beta-propeller fold protein YncE